MQRGLLASGHGIMVGKVLAEAGIVISCPERDIHLAVDRINQLG